MCDEKSNFDRSCDKATRPYGRFNKLHSLFNKSLTEILLKM